MVRTMRLLFSLALLTLLASCGGGGDQAPKLSISNASELADKGMAVVILSSTQQADAPIGLKEWSAPSNWSIKSEPSDFDINKMIFVSNQQDKDTPHIKQVKPGKYSLLSFTFTDGGNVKATSTSGMRGLPLASFTINAGEVLYVGDLLIKTKIKFLGGLQKDFKLSVRNHEALARQHLAKQSPDLARQMKTRLLQLSPLLALMNKKPKT